MEVDVRSCAKVFGLGTRVWFQVPCERLGTSLPDADRHGRIALIRPFMFEIGVPSPLSSLGAQSGGLI
jgi:hypothetical protein